MTYRLEREARGEKDILFGKELRKKITEMLKKKGPLTAQNLTNLFKKQKVNYNAVKYALSKLHGDDIVFKRYKLDDMRNVYYCLNDGKYST